MEKVRDLNTVVRLFANSDTPTEAQSRIAKRLDRIEQQLKEHGDQLKKDDQRLKRVEDALYAELAFKNKELIVLQGQFSMIAPPSAQAVELASRIPERAGKFARALKAVALKHYDDAQSYSGSCPGKR